MTPQRLRRRILAVLRKECIQKPDRIEPLGDDAFELEFATKSLTWDAAEALDDYNGHGTGLLVYDLNNDRETLKVSYWK